MLRLFAAIPVPDDVAACLTPLQVGLPGARWVPRANFHVTLKFIGKVTEPVADEIDAALTTIKGKPFTLEVTGLSSFHDKHDARSVFAAVTKSDRLAALAQKVDNATTGLGLERERRKFTPHITLGRLRDTPNTEVARWIETHGQVVVPPFEVTHFTLYSSLTRPEGSVYTPERHYIL